MGLTEDTINGSIALNAALDETAKLAGAVVRTFDDLSTTDVGIILDQMVASTQQSALEFEKLQTALYLKEIIEKSLKNMNKLKGSYAVHGSPPIDANALEWVLNQFIKEAEKKTLEAKRNETS